MASYQLKDNDDLFRYMEQLSDDLQAKGQEKIANKVRIASRFASGSASEFLHEAQIVLREVKGEYGSMLARRELAELTNIIDQVELAFLRIGSA